MLVLSRKVGETIMIGDQIRIVVVDIRNLGCVRLGIEAPRDISIHRQEVYDAICHKKLDEAGQTGDD